MLIRAYPHSVILIEVGLVLSSFLGFKSIVSQYAPANIVDQVGPLPLHTETKFSIK
jgi:hypothetical protein